jgi:hypothetical protein
MQKISLNQNGFGHLVLILASVVAIGGVGATGLLVAKAHHNNQVNQEQQKQAAAQAQQLHAKKAAPATKAAVKSEASTAKATPCTPDTTMYVSTADGLNLRQDKSFSSAKVVLMPYRAALTAGCLDGDWYTATYSGHTGYANKAYVSATKPAAAPASSSAGTSPNAPAVSAATPSAITISGKVISCSNVPSGTFMAISDPTVSYTSPNGSQQSSYPKYTIFRELTCATTEGWLIMDGQFIKAQDISLTA